MANKILITGGAGFIGSSIARSFAQDGCQITILDDLSRLGSRRILKKLLADHRNIVFKKNDISKNSSVLKEAVKNKDLVFHFAGQVAVNQSISNPGNDFNTNAVGTFNLLEVIRKENPEALMLFSSSMRVYGQMQNEPVVKSGRAYQLKNYPKGIPENYPLNLHTPYSCSKGAADQYVRDYSRVFGLRTVVFRQSCIYGPGQYAIENHGWVNWFIASALAEREIRIFGDGRQVRDILFIDDLVDAYRKAVSSASVINGEILNVGGGPERALSLRELLQMLNNSFDIKTRVEYTSWRKGDTKAYISDVSKAKRLMKWQPKTTIMHGVDATLKWMNGIRIK